MIYFIYIFCFIIYKDLYIKKMLKNLIVKGFSSVKSFGVIGAGQMGTGIAIVASIVAKIPVVLYDSNDIALRNS